MRTDRLTFALLLAAALAFTPACGGDEPGTDPGGSDGGVKPTPDASAPASKGVPGLGGGKHTKDSVEITVVVKKTAGLTDPTDLDFHPVRTDEMWITNQTDNSIIVVQKVGTAAQTAKKASGGNSRHFLAKPAGVAFSADTQTAATAHEIDTPTQATTPANFMGPTMWSTNLTIFDGGHRGHLDMLHNSPNGMGIAWEKGNAYWIFDGANSSLTRYDFRTDHGPGGSDHSDGLIQRYAAGQVKRSPNVPSGMEFYKKTNMLYVADTGNNRIIMMDTTSGTKGSNHGPNYDGLGRKPGSGQYTMNGARVFRIIDGVTTGLEKPSGLSIYKDQLYVADYGTGKIWAFEMRGKMLDWVDTGVGKNALKGIAFDKDGNLHAVDSKAGTVIKITAKK